MNNIGVNLSLTECFVAGKFPNSSIPFLIPDFQDKNIYHTPLIVASKNANIYAGREVELIIQSDNFTDYSYCDFFINNLGIKNNKPLLLDNLNRKREFYATTLMAIVLKKIVHDAKRALQVDEITGVSIAIPPFFDEKKQADLIYAANIANIDLVDSHYRDKYKILNLISSPIAVFYYFKTIYGISSGYGLFVDVASSYVTVTVQNLAADLSSKREVYQMSFKLRTFKIDFFQNFVQIVIALVNQELIKLIGFEVDELSNHYYKLKHFAERIKAEYIKNPDKQYYGGLFEIDRAVYNIVIDAVILKLNVQRFAESISSKIKNKLDELRLEGVSSVVLSGDESRLLEFSTIFSRYYPKAKLYALDNEITNSASMGAALFANQKVSSEMEKKSVNKLEKNIGILCFDPKTKTTKLNKLFNKNDNLPIEKEILLKTVFANQSRIYSECRFYNDDVRNSTLLATITIDLPYQSSAGTEILVKFKYLQSGKLEVLAYDYKAGKKLTVQSLVTESSNQNLHKQADLLKNSYLINSMKTVKGNVI